MRQGIRDYAEWYKLAKSLEFEGPYELFGNPPGEQFVFKTGGTAALWNSRDQYGVVFDKRVEVHEISQ